MTSHLSISRVLSMIFICIVGAAAIILYAFSSYIQNQSVYSIAKEDAHTRSELIFESVYAVMKNGWTRDEIDQVVARFNEKLPNMRVRLIRSENVAKDYGDREEAKIARETDPLIQNVLANKYERIVENGDNLRFIYPIISNQECMQCHTNTAPGDVNGIIEIIFPVDEISIPLEYALNSTMIMFGVIVFLLIVVTILSVRFFMVSPLLALSNYMTDLKNKNTALSANKSTITEIEALRNSFVELISHLNQANEDLKDLTIKDPLTGLSNRRHFDEMLSEELDRAVRYERPFTLFMIDLDKFKPINDDYGHDVGDLVLKEIASTLTKKLRVSDHIARVGGDEFQVISPETDHLQAAGVIHKIQNAIDTLEIFHGDLILKVGCSIGIATFNKDGRDVETLLHCADQRMYEDKKKRKAGR